MSNHPAPAWVLNCITTGAFFGSDSMKLPIPEIPEKVSHFFFYRFYANTDLITGNDWYDWEKIENIPPCGLFDFPPPTELKFRFAKANTEFEIITLPLISALNTMAPEERFFLNPFRWHRVKEQLSNGSIEYPEMAIEFNIPKLMDGRHRTVAMMLLMGMESAPFAVDPEHAEVVRSFFKI